MEKYTQDTIVVNTWAQKALLENELFGQMSDGYWENSRNQSWRFWSKCNVVVDPDAEPHYVKVSDYWGEKSYPLNNTELLSFVGTRMLAIAKFADYTNRELSQDDAYLIEDIVGCNDTDEYPEVTTERIDAVYNKYKDYAKTSDPENYWNKKAKRFSEFVKTNRNILTKALDVTYYNKKDLRKDLRVLTQALKNRA